MTRKELHFEDAELVAFVDHRLSESRRQLIAEMAGMDAALAARIALLTDGTPVLDEAFRADLADVPTSLVAKVKSMVERDSVLAAANTNLQPSRRSWLVAGSAMAASFAAGMFGSRFLGSQGAANDWREAVAQYHALYGERTIERLNPSADERASELASVSKAIDFSLQDIERSAQGYAYKRAQLLEFEMAPLVQIVFEAPGRIPLAFCLKRQRKPVVTGAASSGFTVEQRLDMSLAFWSKDGIDQLIVAKLPEEAIRKLGQQLATRA